MGGGHAIEFFVDGADQHLTPVAFDGAFGLALFAEPVEHADAVEIGTREAFDRDGVDGARDGDFVGDCEELQLMNDPKKCAGAGRIPRLRMEMRPPGSMKKNSR